MRVSTGGETLAVLHLSAQWQEVTMSENGLVSIGLEDTWQGSSRSGISPAVGIDQEACF